jgi:hypothetical protein
MGHLTEKKIVRLAAEHGKNIEHELDEWLKTGKTNEDKIIDNLDILKLSGLPLEVYSYYVDMYNSVASYCSPKLRELEDLV